MMKLFSLVVVGGLLLGGSQAQALPIGDGNALLVDLMPEVAPEVMNAVDFSAIVALSNCSGSLVRFNTSLGSDPAMILTNGHCYERGFLKPGQVLVNAPSMRAFTILNKDGRSQLGVVNASGVLYATMTKTDMALYRVRETFDEIEKRMGVVALTLSASHPIAGRAIAVASGYWRKIYSCSIDGFVFGMREDDWSWTDSIRYTQPGCETIGGTSGSPVIDVDTHEVVGVNNTGNEGGTPCSMNNPCEVDSSGQVSSKEQGSYGQQTYWLYTCLDSKNGLNLNLPGCLLPKP